MRFLKARPKLMVVVALGLLLLVLAPIVSAQWPFPDVNPGDWFYNDVRRIAYLGITVGYPDGTYRPSNPVSRAEMAAYINRLTTASTNQNEPYIMSVDNMNNGANQSGDGIIARSFDRVGLTGISYGGGTIAGDGVVGRSNGTQKSGVWGVHDTDGYGVTGSSPSGFGMYANGGGDGSAFDFIGDLLLGGDRGEIFSYGSRLNLYSNDSIFMMLDHNNNDPNSVFVVYSGGHLWNVDENGDTWAAGTKGARVQTESHGERGLYAMESPEVWFEDFGTASLVEGEATVAIEPIFAETVNLETDYHVFLTPLGEEPVLLFVTDKSATSFTVRGVTLDGESAACALDYRIVAKRRGYEDLRLGSPGL